MSLSRNKLDELHGLVRGVPHLQRVPQRAVVVRGSSAEPLTSTDASEREAWSGFLSSAGEQKGAG
jgi:hypothetical protein